MDVTSAATATLGIWTIARFAALAVLATEALFLYVRIRQGGLDAKARPGDASPGAASRVFWALTPAVLLLGLCFWCTVFVSAGHGEPGRAPAVAQLGR